MIELHVHLDGSLRPTTIWELAREAEGQLPTFDLTELTTLMEAPVPCTSLSQYLSRFELPLRYLQTPKALERVAFEMTEDLAEEGITYGEIRFAPQLSIHSGLSQKEVVTAVIAGVERGMISYPSIKIGILLCCLRGNEKEVWEKNMETLGLVANFQNDGVVCGIDLAGAEELYDTGVFRELFQEADRYSLKRTIHAGEAAGPDSVWKALEMGAMRIGHGISSIQDPALMKELTKRNIPLEICVTSNVQTKGVPSLKEHPIRKLYDAGVPVTLNTDNRTVSRTTLLQEIALVKQTFGFTDEDLRRMEGYAAKAAFLLL